MFSFVKRTPVGGLLAVRHQPGRLQCARFTYVPESAPILDFWHDEAVEGECAVVLPALVRRHGLKGARCSTLLAATDYRLVQTDLPTVPEDEMREALRWQLRDQVDLPVETSVLDFLPLPEVSGANRARQAFAALAADQVIAPVVQGFQAAQLGLSIIDLPEMAQRNIARLFEVENRGLAFLVFGEHSALLTFTFQGQLFALRRIEIGAVQFAGATPERREQLAERVVLELQRSMDTVDRQFSGISLSRLLVVLPPDSGLETHLAGALYLPFEAADLASVLDLSRYPLLIEPEMQRHALLALGAALRPGEA